MANHRTPLARAKLTGADKANPKRFKNRSEPRTSRDPVGKPPSYLDAEARAEGKTPHEAAQAAQDHVNGLLIEMQRARGLLEAEGARRQ